MRAAAAHGLTETAPDTDKRIWSAVWAAWPLVAFAGGLGFPAVAILAALSFAYTGRRSLQGQGYMLPLLAFLAYAAASQVWSPEHARLIEFAPERGKYAIKSHVLRVTLVLAAAAFVIAVARTAPAALAGRIRSLAGWMLFAQLVIVGIGAAFLEPLLGVFAPLLSSPGEGVQDISRNSLLLAASFGGLVFATTDAPGARQVLAWSPNAWSRIAMMALLAVCLIVLNSEAGLLAIAFGLACVAAIRLMPGSGFRAIGVTIAAAIMAAPLVFGEFATWFRHGPPLTSTQWRMDIWARVKALIDEAPVSGSGVGVLRTLPDRIAEGPLAGQVLVPNHAHNMLMQLWAETGLVGALLASAAIVLAAWRLPAPGSLGRAASLVAASIGGMFAIACVSFDLWNEWWWAACGLLATLCVLAARAEADASG